MTLWWIYLTLSMFSLCSLHVLLLMTSFLQLFSQGQPRHFKYLPKVTRLFKRSRKAIYQLHTTKLVERNGVE
ncbi:unnamed protein product [Brassica oleracea]